MVDYTRYDYDQLVRRMTDILKDKPGWGNAYESSTGQELIQLMADSVDYLHYMLERRSQEMYIDTARLPSSVIARASEVGYRPRRRRGARGTLNLQLQDEDGNIKPAQGEVVVKEGTSIFFDDIEFIVLNTVQVLEGESDINIDVVQGTMTTFTFDAIDIGDSRFVSIPDFRQYDNEYIRVRDAVREYVDVAEGGPDLAAIGAISFAAVGEPYYDIRYPASGMRVIFGDEISGVIPDDTVQIDLISTLGSSVSIQSTVEFEFETETITDDVVITPKNKYFYSLQNITSVDGGLEPEEIESIRTNATGFIRTNNRAVSREDYKFWTKQSNVGSIVDAESFGEQEINTLIFNSNNVFISYLTDDGNELSPAEQRELREYLGRLSAVGTHLVLKPVNIVDMQYDIQLRRFNQLPISDSELHDIIRRIMRDVFELKDLSIGKGYQQSDIIDEFYRFRLVRNGVSYPILDFIKVELSGLYEVNAPLITNIARVTMDQNAALTTGEVFILVLDGVTYSVTVDSGDTVESLMGKMRDAVYLSTDYTIRHTVNEIRITSVDRGRTFTVDASQGDLIDRVENKYIVKIPPKTFDNPTGVNLFLAGSFSIIDENGFVLFEDDGNGNLNDVDGVVLPGDVDYVTGEVGFPIVSPGKYFVRFKQDQFDNYIANSETAIRIVDAKSNYLDTNEELSKIILV